MHRQDVPAMDRRRFVVRALPGCAATCALFGAAGASAGQQPLAAQPGAKPPAHKFDSELPRKLTYRESFALGYTRAFIPLVLFMSKTLGRDRTAEILKASLADQAPDQAAAAVKAAGGNDFAAFKRFMENPGLKNVWTHEVVEDNDTVYAVRVSECLWAETFRAANAGEEGYAAVCHGDYVLAKAFNPKLELTRDRTLMQGHPYCNHRYVWKG